MWSSDYRSRTDLAVSCTELSSVHTNWGHEQMQLNAWVSQHRPLSELHSGWGFYKPADFIQNTISEKNFQCPHLDCFLPHELSWRLSSSAGRYHGLPIHSFGIHWTPYMEHWPRPKPSQFLKSNIIRLSKPTNLSFRRYVRAKSDSLDLYHTKHLEIKQTPLCDLKHFQLNQLVRCRKLKISSSSIPPSTWE